MPSTEDSLAPDQRTLSRALARAVIRLRWGIVVGWVAAAVAATVWLPSIEEGETGALGSLIPADADAITAEVRASELFRFPVLARTLVVQRDPEGLSAPAQARVLRRAVALNRGQYPEARQVAGALAITNLLGQPPFSRERSTTAITYLLFRPEVGREQQTRAARAFAARRIPAADAPIGVTGAIPARSARVDAITDRLPLVEGATLLLVTLVVAVIFRAVLAPLVNLAAIAIAFLVSVRAVAALGQELDLTVPQEVTPVIVALLFGVITDYSIFFLSPFRRRLHETRDVRRATEDVIAQQLPLVLVAGLTVSAAGGALVVARLGFFQAFGPGVGLAALVGLLVAVTFVPALVAIVGSALFWPRRPRPGEDAGDAGPARRLTAGVMAFVAARPLAVAAGCVVLLGAAASGLRELDVGNPLIRGLPAGAEARRAYTEASKGFAPGILSPAQIVVEGRGVTRRREALRELQSLLDKEPGVAAVLGPQQQATGFDFGAVYSRTGDAARYLVVLTADPLGNGAIRTLRRLKARVPAYTTGVGLPAVTVGFAGDTALVEETVTKTREDLSRVAPAVLGVVFLILAAFLRALVAPLYLVAASVLAVAASLGLTAYVMQRLVGHPELSFYVPFGAAVLLVALGSDYNVYVAGRIWQEARERPLREAVALAGERAAGAVAAAGLVLAGSFAMLALVPLRSFQELAFAMMAGLLIDAFLVRTLLVPALVVLVGERGRWPGRPRRRRHPARRARDRLSRGGPAP